jgi:CheY-like chemotaxis protein
MRKKKLPDLILLDLNMPIWDLLNFFDEFILNSKRQTHNNLHHNKFSWPARKGAVLHENISKPPCRAKEFANLIHLLFYIY